MPTDARDLSCEALTDVLDGGVFHGDPVAGYAAELARRGEAVYSCENVGCDGEGPWHGCPHLLLCRCPIGTCLRRIVVGP